MWQQQTIIIFIAVGIDVKKTKANTKIRDILSTLTFNSNAAVATAVTVGVLKSALNMNVVVRH